MLPATNMETEASQMLEAALEQMDDIIAGKSSEEAVFSFRGTGNMWSRC